MWKALGALLLAAALAHAENDGRVETLEQAVRACTAATSNAELLTESLSDYYLPTEGPLATGASDGLVATASSGPQGFAAFPFPGKEPFRHLSAAADPTTKPWEIIGALGFTLTDGNSNTITLTVTGDANREWEHWKLFMGIRILYAESEDVQTASEWIFLERLERKLSERATIFQDFMLEHDEEEDLRYRIQFTMGYNRRLVKKENFELWGNIGAGVLHEAFFDETETELIAQLGINFTWQITKQLKYTQIITFYPSLSESGEYRMYWESVFTTPIGERFDLRLSITDRYDSNPQPGIEKNDLTIALSLVIRFTEPLPK